MKKIPVYLSQKEINDARVALTLATLDVPPEVAERLVKLIDKLGEELDTFEVSDISEDFQKQVQSDFDKFYALAQNLFEEDEIDFDQIDHEPRRTKRGGVR